MTQITRHPSAFTNTTGFNGNWTDPGNAYATDAAYATEQSTGRNTEFATNWRGFDMSAIPSDATINSVDVYVRCKISAANSKGEWRSSIWEDVTVAAALTAGTTGALDNGAQYTQPASNTTEADWHFAMTTLPTVAQLQATNFGVRVQIARGNTTTSYLHSLNDIWIVVDYTEATTPKSGSDSPSAATDASSLGATIAGADAPAAATEASTLAVAVGGSDTATATDGSTLSLSFSTADTAGAATDAASALVVDVAGSDSATAQDGLYAREIALEDAGTGATDTAALAAALAAEDAIAPATEGSALDSSTVVQGSDQAGATAEASTLEAAVAASEVAGVASDTAQAPAVSLTATDTATATDAALVLEVAVGASDTGTAAEALGDRELAVADAGTSVESGSIDGSTAKMTGDTATATDAVVDREIATGDNASGGDAATDRAFGLAEFAASEDGSALAAAIASNESPHATEVAALLAALIGTEAGSGTDVSTGIGLNRSDVGTVSELAALLAALAASDSGTGTDVGILDTGVPPQEYHGGDLRPGLVGAINRGFGGGSVRSGMPHGRTNR